MTTRIQELESQLHDKCTCIDEQETTILEQPAASRHREKEAASKLAAAPLCTTHQSESYVDRIETKTIHKMKSGMKVEESTTQFMDRIETKTVVKMNNGTIQDIEYSETQFMTTQELDD